MLKRYFSLAVFLVFTLTAFPADLSSIREIRIESSRAGLEVLRVVSLKIVRSKGHFKMGHKTISDSLVQNLVNALDEPAIGHVELSNFGISQAWLDSHAQSALEAAPYYRNDEQKQRFVKSFTDLNSTQGYISALFVYGKTDDYSRVKVTVLFEGGKTVTAFSTSYFPFMVPWQIDRSGQEAKTYNANISRAVAVLMPRKATNRASLAGDGLEQELAEAIWHSIRNW